MLTVPAVTVRAAPPAPPLTVTLSTVATRFRFLGMLTFSLKVEAAVTFTVAPANAASTPSWI